MFSVFIVLQMSLLVQAHEAEWPPNSVTGKELRNRHAEERQKAKMYLETLQHDNEVLLILKMRQRRLLW